MPKYKTIFEKKVKSVKRELSHKKFISQKHEAVCSVNCLVIENYDSKINEKVTHTDETINTVIEPFCNSTKAPNIDIVRKIECSYENLADSMTNLTSNELLQFLKQWAIKNSISHKCLNEQLQFFQKYFPNIPKDSRTILATPTSTNLIDMPPGKYVHIGIENGIKISLSKFEETPSSLEVNFHIDGVPISRSTSSSFWIIQGRCSTSDNIFIVGIYHGYKKPDNFNIFLEPFVEELHKIMNVLEFNGVQIFVTVGVIICDTPAKAAILGIKNHGGYSSCPNCFVVGDYLNNRMTLQDSCAKRRTNLTFRVREDETHHNHNTVLSKLNIDLVEQFPLDYLHIVLLGVMKKFLKMITQGGIESKLHSRNLNAISKRIRNITNSIPREFQKNYLPSLSKMHEYKASHYRTILLYIGPIIFKDIIGNTEYNHFLFLHVAILLLCHENPSTDIVKFAGKLLNQYIDDFKIIYGRHHIVYVVHALCHLAENVERHGNLDKYSSFPYESFNYKIKKMLRKFDRPLAQIHRRLAESQYSTIKVNEIKSYPILKKKSTVVIESQMKMVFKEIEFKKFKISNTKRDQWYITEEKQIIKYIHAEVINDNIFIYGAQIKNTSNFYESPIYSSNINVFKADYAEYSPTYWNIHTLSNKMFCIEKYEELVDWVFDGVDDEELILPAFQVFYPLIHSNTLL